LPAVVVTNLAKNRCDTEPANLPPVVATNLAKNRRDGSFVSPTRSMLSPSVRADGDEV
jgi:hypothetical protein